MLFGAQKIEILKTERERKNNPLKITNGSKEEKIPMHTPHHPTPKPFQ